MAWFEFTVPLPRSIPLRDTRASDGGRSTVVAPCGVIRSRNAAIYDSIAIHHDQRWNLPLPPRADTLAYTRRERDRLLERLEPGTASEVPWAGRGLPHEREWEAAALGEPSSGGSRLSETKRRYPWGGVAADAARANLDGRSLGCVDVAALANGDSAFGCRQMLGNVWEWCADAFCPYPVQRY